MKCNEGFCGMEFKTDKESSCCFFCEFKNKCKGVCSTVEFHRSEDEIINCSNFIVEKKEVKENLKFKIAQLVMTCGIEALLKENELDFLNIAPLLFRHMDNDSELCQEDLELNVEAIKSNCGRVLSKFNFLGEKIYIITDGLGTENYNYTTILLADEY